MAQDLSRKWAADPGVVKAVCSTAPDIQTRPNFGFDEGPRLRAQIRQKGQTGKMGAGYESKNCSVAWASRSINRTRESSAVISSDRNEALKAVRAHAMEGAIVAQGGQARCWV